MKRIAMLLALCAIPAVLATTRNALAETNTASAVVNEQRSLEVALKQRAKEPKELSGFVESLLDADKGNLDILLDVVLPDGAALVRPPSNTVSELSERLSSEDYAVVREAIVKLHALGPGATDQVKTQMVGATDPVVSIFLAGVVSCWEMSSLDESESYQVQRVLSQYIEGITNTATVLALQKRVLHVTEQEGRDRRPSLLLTSVFRASVRTKDDNVVNQLSPLLEDDNVSLATTVVRTIGSGRDNRYFPELLLVALQSDRPQVVNEAISWAPNCWDGSKTKDVRRALESIFDGENELLKFRACFPLMHGYHDGEAVTYLLSQVKSENKSRSRRAISWIGDACNSGRKACPELLEALVPLLSSEDVSMRRAAANALGTYSGEQVVKHIIPLLGDVDKTIVSEVSYELLNQRDKNSLRRLLSEAADSADATPVSTNAKDILEKLDAKQRKQNKAIDSDKK
jgi:HEAT repeat protein